MFRRLGATRGVFIPHPQPLSITAVISVCRSQGAMERGGEGLEIASYARRFSMRASDAISFLTPAPTKAIVTS